VLEGQTMVCHISIIRKFSLTALALEGPLEFSTHTHTHTHALHMQNLRSENRRPFFGGDEPSYCAGADEAVGCSAVFSSFWHLQFLA